MIETDRDGWNERKGEIGGEERVKNRPRGA